MDDSNNGPSRGCLLLNGEGQDALAHIEETHAMVSELHPSVVHLNRLEGIDLTLREIKTALLNAATGTDRVPLQVVNQLFKLMAWISLALVSIIVFLLTGVHFNWISVLR